jgi:hypothetical protein
MPDMWYVYPMKIGKDKLDLAIGGIFLLVAAAAVIGILGLSAGTAREAASISPEDSPWQVRSAFLVMVGLFMVASVYFRKLWIFLPTVAVGFIGAGSMSAMLMIGFPALLLVTLPLIAVWFVLFVGGTLLSKVMG